MMLARLGSFIAIALLAAACGPPQQGPTDIVWDRDVCAHCQMVISDRHFAAQIRSSSDHRMRLFDDIGCALLWQDEAQRSSGEPVEEFWVANRSGDGWVRADEARFEEGHQTPMNHGLRVADAKDWPTAFSLELAREKVFERERERRNPGN